MNFTVVHALKFDKYLGSIAAEAPVKFQSNAIIETIYFTDVRHCNWHLNGPQIS